MSFSISKEEFLYNKSIGDMGIFLVMKKLLPNELSLIHYDILVNIEVVDMNNEEEVKYARKLMLETYDKLKKHWKFRNKIKLEDDRIVLLPE